MNGQMRKYKKSLVRTQMTDVSAKLHRVQIDYDGLINFAQSKGVSVPELSDDDKNRFIKNCDISTINKMRMV